MAKSKAFSPTPDEVVAHLEALQRAHPHLVEVTEAGRSEQGRPILAAAVTAPEAPADDKQHVLIVGGQHGNEEGGRMIALATLDWLVSRVATATRRRQKVVIVPCVNPDGAELDLHNTPADVAPNLDHPDTGATSPEGRAVEAVARPLAPEAFVDLHARGYTGHSFGMVLFPDTKVSTEDGTLLHAIAADMARAGEAAGMPHAVHPLTWPGWGGPGIDHPSTTCWVYRQFKSISLLTEVAEDDRYSYPAADRVRSGLAKVKALLAWGNRRHPKLYYSGYPCGLVAGLFVSGIVAVGRSAAERRASRLAAWARRADFLQIDRCYPERPDDRRIVLHFRGRALRSPVGLQTFVRGHRRVRSVHWNGRVLKPAEAAGWTTWQDPCTTYVVAAAADLPAGEHELRIRYEAAGP